MKTTASQDKALLLKTAQTVFKELENRTKGTSLHLRWPGRIGKVNTGGLATVCSNCHRMLHRMDGKRGDVEKLASIIRKHKGRKH